MKKKKQDWKPATEFRTVKLSRNGPKPGQNTSDWMKGKQKEQDRYDRKRDTMNPLKAFPDL